MIILFYTASSSIWEFQLLHILTKVWYCHLIVAILVPFVAMIYHGSVTFPQSLKMGPSSKDTLAEYLLVLLSSFYCAVCLPIELCKFFCQIYKVFSPSLWFIFFIFLMLSFDEQEILSLVSLIYHFFHLSIMSKKSLLLPKYYKDTFLCILLLAFNFSFYV